MLASQQYGTFYCHSPPSSFLADYGTMPLADTMPVPQIRTRTVYAAQPQRHITRVASAPTFATLKPIVIHLGDVKSKSCLKSNKNHPRAVQFADDVGEKLEHIRVMTEPSYVPPYWNMKIITNEKQPIKQEKPLHDSWELRFSQPITDYVRFKRKLTDENVALEKVIIKELDSLIEGTVKVTNLDFSKEVFVRSTADGWRTSEDTFCAYCETGPDGAYDTFTFRIQLPVQSRKMEFCVGFKCLDKEYWDNCDGCNYIVERKSARFGNALYTAALHSGSSWNCRESGDTPYW